jgi:colicin import membrane protein
MAEQKESSVLFSLKELMNLEEDRIKQEDNARKAKQEAELQARLDAERRQREDEEARIRGEEDRRRAEEQRVREEQARIEAIHNAEVEKARLEAENAARLESMKRQQEHERHVLTIKQDKHKRNLLIAAVGAALLLIFGAVGAAMVIKGQNDKAAAIAAEQQKQNLELQAKMDALNKQLEDGKNNIDNLQNQLGTVSDTAQKLALEKQLAEAKKAQELAAKERAKVAASRPAGGGGGGGPTKPRAACTCQSGDPLCSCIQ